jgi:hypothetical protein
VRWYDDSNHVAAREPAERVTIVPRGAWGKFEHTHWRVLGMQKPTVATSASDVPAGGTQIVLELEAKVLDQQGVKELSRVGYEIRDREGHVWSAFGQVQNQSIDEAKPVPGSTQRVKVTGMVPQSKLSSVVLDARLQPSGPAGAGKKVLHVLRFAH